MINWHLKHRRAFFLANKGISSSRMIQWPLFCDLPIWKTFRTHEKVLLVFCTIVCSSIRSRDSLSLSPFLSMFHLHFTF